MDSSRDHRERITAANQVDYVFDDYEIEMMPAEALSFAATAQAAGITPEALYELIDQLNHAIPPAQFGLNHPKTGTAHHTFRIGRRHGDRLLVLDLFKGYFLPGYPFDELVDAMHVYAEKAGSQFNSEPSESTHRLTFLWSTRAND